MAIDVALYRSRIHPANLCQLLDDRTLGHLLNGFAYRLKSGVGLLYAEDNASPLTPPGALRREDVIDDPRLALQVAHKFCRLYRGTPVHDDRCRDFDRAVAVKYYSREWLGPQLYRCHMQLWDMTYPLVVDSHLLGVLFGGQILVHDSDPPKDSTLEWLQRVAPSVDVAHAATQLLDIDSAIECNAAPATRDELRSCLMSDSSDTVTWDGLTGRFSDFCAFGVTLTALLEKLYPLTGSLAKEQILREIGDYLAAAPQDRLTWWGAVAAAVADVITATDCGPILVFAREASRYVEVVNEHGAVPFERARRIPTAHCLNVAPDVLLPAVSAPELSLRLDLDVTARLFRFDSALAQNQGISFLFVVKGAAPAFSDELFRLVGLHAAIAMLLFRKAHDQAAFAKRVRNVSHSTKTPLQLTFDLIQSVKRTLRRRKVDLPLFNQLDEAQEHLLDAKVEMGDLYEGLPKPRTLIDLKDLLCGLMDEMAPLARARSCHLVLHAATVPLPVRVSVTDVRIAFRNLVDNAIKYSYEHHDVRLTVRLLTNRRVEVSCSNFGIGVPDDLLQAICDEGVRGLVPDFGWPSRLGSGLGIPIAVDHITSHGGTFDIDSVAADDDPREPYHRFVTTVTVTLPVA
jgi:signal transduction histidine kinase